MSDQPLLTFPCRYPVKVFGYSGQDLEARVRALLEERGVELLDALRERPSRGERFVAVHFDMQATSREQVESLAGDLKALDGVVMVL